MTIIGTEANLTVAGRDLACLLAIMRAVGTAGAVTVAHTAHPTLELNVQTGEIPSCAVVELEPMVSAVDVRTLLDRSPGVRFVFLAERLPLRHAVARIIREAGHTALERDDAPVVIAATAMAVLAAHTKASQ
jgi:hypothetical protein